MNSKAPFFSKIKPGSVVVIGNFDGVHRGHQAVLKLAKRLAEAEGLALEVVTFEPHPRTFFTPQEPVERLCSAFEKVQLLQQFGAERVHVMTFDKALATLTPEAFIRQELLPLKPRHIVVGENFRFGHKAAGTVQTLEAQGTQHGFMVHPLVAVEDAAGEVISSSRIRSLRAAGKTTEVEELLGHKGQI